MLNKIEHACVCTMQQYTQHDYYVAHRYKITTFFNNRFCYRPHVVAARPSNIRPSSAAARPNFRPAHESKHIASNN
jgi:hypothetical protein